MQKSRKDCALKGTVGAMEKEVEYISDGNYNYLRINCGEERKNSYSFKMMTENSIKGLLPCRIRFVNGNTYIYYEIQSKQSLFYRYEIREIDYEALKNIFFHLSLLGEELEKYLLDINDIDFDEKYIYQNIETGETYFLFHPNKEQKQSFSVFMEYIVKRINHKDAKAVKISYQLYDLSRKERILVSEIKRLFEEEIEENRVVEQLNSAEVWRERAEKNREEERKETGKGDAEREEWDYKDVKENNAGEEKNTKLADILIPSILCIVFTVFICIKLSFNLTYSENIILIGGMVVDAGVLVGYFVYKQWKKNNEKKEKQESNEYDFERDSRNLYGKPVRERITENTEWDYTERDYTERGNEESYGKTVFMEPEAENILCGLGKYEKVTIKLENFPFSIGKLKEEADYVLKDNSISRLHARFYQEGKSIYVMDLNSTNGTYKNGFKIPPNEKIRLEEGDEIAFGKIRFCYR